MTTPSYRYAEAVGDVPPATLLGAGRIGYVDQLVEIDATVVRADV